MSLGRPCHWAAIVLLWAIATAGAPPPPPTICGPGNGFPCIGDCELLGLFPSGGLCWEVHEMEMYEEKEGSNCSHQYKLLDVPLPFEAAELACQTYDYHLAGFEYLDQVDAVAAYLQSENYWIGLRSEGPGPVIPESFEFMSGINMTFGLDFGVSPWAPQNPADDQLKRCVMQQDLGGGRFWTNVDCLFPRKPLCQKTTKCMPLECECGELGKAPCELQPCKKYLKYNEATGICESCGGFGQPPCETDGCLPGLVQAPTGSCTYCGVRGAPPCVRKSGEVECIEDNQLDEYSGTCVECGGVGQPVCSTKLRWRVKNSNGCAKKCCPCNGEACYEWTKEAGTLLVGNECSGEFEFTYKGDYPNANITVPEPVSCTSTGQGEPGYQQCDVGHVPSTAEYCNSIELFPAYGKCVHECSL